MSNGILSWLQEWYASQCDGDWEHQHGIKIETLDNPGWGLTIDLAQTNAECAAFDGVEHYKDDLDWINCKVSNQIFVAHCGPLNLSKVVEIFREWVSSLPGT